MSQGNKEYLLGANHSEFERLQFQHSVWRTTTNNFLDRLGVSKGWHCLDVGAGPGFVSIDLRERVDKTGSVTALEPSPLFLDHLAHFVQKNNWGNVHLIRSTVEETVLPQQQYDLIFARWVIAFVAHPENFFLKLLASLKPGGIIAFQDYYYEGLSLYPRGGAFDRMADAVRGYYRTVEGDPYITGKMPEWFRRHGMTLVDYSPHIYSGGPTSAIFEWAHRFFSTHIQQMVDKKAMTQSQGDAMLADWMEHRKNPDALFFSPVVVDVAGRKE
ncbi:MAG: methyltransferase domain-containing protein [Ignavibacteriales bacterium]|nr:methyltransferase domain-containing protein [Ignavibacteriales bacterium]